MRALLYLIVVVAVSESMSFESARADSDGKKPAIKAERAAITKAQEAAAISFVKQHHPELFELIKYLQMGMPREYEQAIRDLSHTSERLAQIEKRDVDRYQLELRLWQAESRRQLLTARLQMDPDEALISDLRNTLQQELELATNIARHERDRLANRLERLNEQIENQVQNRDTLVERKLSTLTKAAKASERKTQAKTRRTPTTKTKKQPT